MPEGPGRHVAMLVRNAYTHDTRVEKEVQTLVGAGYRVTVVADAGPDLPASERRDGAQVVRVPRRGPRLPGLRFVLHEWRLARVLAALRPDVLHAHDTNALLPVSVAALRLRIRYVYDAHDLWLGRPRRERNRAYFALSQAYHALIERLLVPRAAAVMTVSPPISTHLRRRYRLPVVHLVPNYPPPPTEPLVPRSLRDLPGGRNLEDGLPIVLYLGGLMAGRGLESLVDAVSRLPHAQLVMLGSGLEAEPLRRRAAANGARLTVIPPVPPEEVIDYAASADLGVSPIVPSCLNYRYSLPNKLFQYMAAAIPVVASDFPQVRDIVLSSGAGRVVDTSRPDLLAEAIASVLADPVGARESGVRGRQAIADRYHWGAAADTLLEIYRVI